ncbi:MAG: SDR family NAD(P)-dependent oxidoreductase [Pyrinomonadaceae bacterium]
MENELREKVALVTGASSGIGRATALRFAGAGGRIALVGRDAEALAAIAREIESGGSEVFAVPADVTNESEAQRAVAATIEQFGQLDVLVNAAGVLSSGTVENTKLEAWDAMLNVNLRAAFIRKPHMAQARRRRYL